MSRKVFYVGKKRRHKWAQIYFVWFSFFAATLVFVLPFGLEKKTNLPSEHVPSTFYPDQLPLQVDRNTALNALATHKLQAQFSEKQGCADTISLISPEKQNYIIIPWNHAGFLNAGRLLSQSANVIFYNSAAFSPGECLSDLQMSEGTKSILVTIEKENHFYTNLSHTDYLPLKSPESFHNPFFLMLAENVLKTKDSPYQLRAGFIENTPYQSVYSTVKGLLEQNFSRTAGLPFIFDRSLKGWGFRAILILLAFFVWLPLFNRMGEKRVNFSPVSVILSIVYYSTTVFVYSGVFYLAQKYLPLPTAVLSSFFFMFLYLWFLKRFEKRFSLMNTPESLSFAYNALLVLLSFFFPSAFLLLIPSAFIYTKVAHLKARLKVFFILLAFIPFYVPLFWFLTQVESASVFRLFDTTRYEFFSILFLALMTGSALSTFTPKDNTYS